MQKKSLKKCTSSLIFLFVLLLAISGCANSGSGDSAGGYQGTDATAQTYTVSGRIISPVSLAPIEGITCVLESGYESKGTVVSYTTRTDNTGNYSFPGICSGNYKLRTTKDGNIPDNSFFNVTQNKKVNLTSISKSEWDTVMGSNHPYDSTQAYVSAFVDHTGAGTPPVNGIVASREPGKEGVKVDLFSNGTKGSGYQSRCYFDANGKADWNATSTSKTGVAMFYSVLPGNKYTMKAAKTGHSFNDVTDVSPVKGEFTNYMINAKDENTKPLSGLCFGPWLTGANNQPVSLSTLQSLVGTIAPYAYGIRTYTMQYGMQALPAVAKGLNPPLTVAACAYLDSSANSMSPGSITEIINLIAAAKQGNVDIALVGSEATSVGVTESTLISCIQYVKGQLSSTLTNDGNPVQVASGLMYSEAQDSSIVSQCDIIFVHLYPMYAPGGINGSDTAAIEANLNWQLNYFQGLYGTAKEIIFGEIGYATAGSPPPPSGTYPNDIFNDANALNHLQTVQSWANANGIKYFYFEAYDEQWKSQGQSALQFEANMGIWDSNMNLKPGFNAVIK